MRHNSNFVISWKSQPSFHRYSNFYIPSTWIILTLQLVVNDEECIFDYILNRKSFGHKLGSLTDIAIEKILRRILCLL